jgi:hypothetical protein
MTKTFSEFTIKISKDDQSDKIKVIINHDNPPFECWMGACERLMDVVAKQSGAGYEKALELLVQGAMKYSKIDDE